MRFIFSFALVVSLLFSCGGDKAKTDDKDSTATTEEKAPKDIPQPHFDCKMVVEPENDRMEPPMTIVSLKVGDQLIPVDSVAAASVIGPESYKDYKIPGDALEACGGYYAGGGDYFYLKKDGNDYVVMYGWSDEGAEDKDMYQYEEIKRIPGQQ